MNPLNQTLGELARDVPGAKEIFHRYHLDFCCGASQTLQQAAQKHSIDANALVAELADSCASHGETDWARALDLQLIEHILERYHDVHRQQFPQLIRLAKRVELIHGGHPACPAGLTAHLEQMQLELEDHMRKEEEILFPMIVRGMRTASIKPVVIMRHDHEDHGQALARIRTLTRGFNLPADACGSWAALYTGLNTLATDLINHIHLENNILYQRIDTHVQ